MVKYLFTDDQYAAFTTSKYMRTLYENKSAILSSSKQLMGNGTMVEFGEPIDLDLEKDVVIPFIREYNDGTLNKT